MLEDSWDDICVKKKKPNKADESLPLLKSEKKKDNITEDGDKNDNKEEKEEDNGEENSKKEAEQAKQLTPWQKRKRKMKNRRRCKNKFKKDEDKANVIEKVGEKENENVSEVAQNVSSSSVDSKQTETSAEDPVKKVKTSNKKSSDALEDKLVTKLKGSRFRYINEQLYTCNSKEAQNLFDNDPEAFHVYHQGFLSQVKKWPVKPLDQIIQWLKSKPQKLIVADFGCGEAFLAQSVKHKVHSFDLVALNDRVTVCDISNVPLPKDSVDIVVFCLSLMGTNCQEFVIEANRVLKEKGVLKIAEVGSRYKSTKMFINDMKSLGFTLKKKDLTNNYFYMFEFFKSKSLNFKIDKQYKGLQLSACLYKKR